MYGARSKYGNTRTEYNGQTYMSKFEASVAMELDMRLKSGEFVQVVSQYRIPLYVYLATGERMNIFTYVCDFRSERPDGTFLLTEAKGMATNTYRIKKKILELVWLPDHPNYQFEEVRRK